MKLTLCKLSTLLLLSLAYADDAAQAVAQAVSPSPEELAENTRHKGVIDAIAEQRQDNSSLEGVMEQIEAERELCQREREEADKHHHNVRDNIKARMTDLMTRMNHQFLDKFNLPDYNDTTKCITFPGRQQPDGAKFDAWKHDNLANDFTDAWHYRHYVIPDCEWSGYQLERVPKHYNLWRGTNKHDSYLTGLGATADARVHTVEVRISSDGNTLECRFSSKSSFMNGVTQISWTHEHTDATTNDEDQKSIHDAEWLPMEKHDGTWSSTGDAYILKVDGYGSGWLLESDPSTKKGIYRIQIEDA